MGTTAHLIVVDGSVGDLDGAVARLEQLEERWSRFRPDSEVSRLNRMPGIPVVVSRETFTLIDHALAGVRLTDGRFDPTLLPELRHAGYDRTFELIDPASRPPGGPTTEPLTRRRSPLETIHLDPVARTVRLDPGTELDPGGVGKGLAADLVVDELLAHGAAGALVNIGGDLYAAGAAPDPSGWVVAVSDPHDHDRVVTNLRIAAGAIASSWRTKRAWIQHGTPQHHLIDPRTSHPASTGLAGVTVISGRGWHADVLAKAAFLAGGDHAGDVLARNNATGIIFHDDGTAEQLSDLGPYLA